MDIEDHDLNHDEEFVLDYKVFLLGMRNIEIAVPYIILNENISPKLFGYVSKLHLVKFVDGYYHVYCSEIKQIIIQFIYFWMEQINDAIREADRLTHSITKSELMRLIIKSGQIHEQRHIDFAREFLPSRTPEEQEEFDKIVEKFDFFMEEFRNNFIATADALDKPQTVTDFAKKCYEISIHKRTALLEYTHSYISVVLAHNTYRIRCCLEECLLRVKNNLKKMKADRDMTLDSLMIELYNKNKERLTESRKENKSFFEEADIEFSLKKLRNKIEEYHKTTPIPLLEDEVRLREERLRDYCKIESVLKKLKRAKETTLKLEERYNSLRCIDIVRSKQEHWENIGKNIQQRKAYLEEKLADAAKALVTFFGVRGQNRILYTNNIGKYIVDDYGHQVYFFDSAARICHVDCYGNYKEVCETDKYYYDKNGRYVTTASGNKLYQAGACTSSYNLGNDNLLEKITVDCGHSDNIRPDCKMQLRNPNDREVLPAFENVDLTEVLRPETVQYLWKNVAHILAEPLRDVEKLRTKNPIHDLAHSIVFHRYRKTVKELNEDLQEADKFRENILEERKNKLIEQSKAWKVKQTQPRKPAESEDWLDRVVYDAQIERMGYIRSLNFFNDN